MKWHSSSFGQVFGSTQRPKVIRTSIPNPNLTPVQKEHRTITKTHKQLNASKPIKSEMQLPVVIAAPSRKQNLALYGARRGNPKPSSSTVPANQIAWEGAAALPAGPGTCRGGRFARTGGTPCGFPRRRRPAIGEAERRVPSRPPAPAPTPSRSRRAAAACCSLGGRGGGGGDWVFLAERVYAEFLFFFLVCSCNE